MISDNFIFTKSEMLGNEKCPWIPFPTRYALEPFCGRSPRRVGPPPCLAFSLSILLLVGIQSSRKTRVYLVRARATDLPDFPGTHTAECARADVNLGITVMTRRGLRAGSSRLAAPSVLT